MPTYKLIASSTVGAGGASSITFSSIPQTYTDLVVITSLRSVENVDGRFNVGITFNGSSSGYSQRLLYNSAGTAGSDQGSSLAQLTFYYGNKDGTTANTYASGTFYIPNYTSANNKSVSFDSVTENNSASNYIMGLTAGLWANTAAITSITLVDASSGGNLKQYSTAYLYGISNA